MLEVLLTQAVVIDARGHMLGRLASVVAKQILSGQHIVSYGVPGCTTTPCSWSSSCVRASLPHARV